MQVNQCKLASESNMKLFCKKTLQLINQKAAQNFDIFVESLKTSILGIFYTFSIITTCIYK